MLAGWWWGSVRLDALDRSVLVPEIGHSARATVVVTGPARKTPFAIRVPAEVRRFDSRALRERVLLELPVGRSPPQGAVLALRVSVAAPRGAEDGFDERGWLARRGVHVVLHGDDWRIVGRRGGHRRRVRQAPRAVARAIAPGLGGERRAVLAGVVLGEDEGLTDELRGNFKASGLYHLLAVSGQNIAFLAIGVLGLAWLLGIHRLAAEVAAIGAIVAYVLAVGWQPSVVRAGVAGGLASLAWLLARPRDRWHFLALGAAVLLAWTPACLYEPGFQLSFAAVGAIFLLLPRLRLALEGYPMPAWLRDALAVSTACGAATAPILWLQFGSVPVYSLLANALVALAIGPLLGLALVGALLEPVLPSVALALAWVNGWVAAYIAACAGMVAGLPFAQIGSGKAVCVLLGTPVALLALQRLPRWRRPAALGVRCDRRPRPARLAALPVHAAAAAEGAPHHVPRRRPGRRDPPAGRRGRGSSSTKAHPRRTSRSSSARSACGGWLRSSSPIRSATTSAAPRRCCAGSRSTGCSTRCLTRSSGYERAALAEAEKHGVEVVETRAGDTFRLGRLHLRVLWPDRPGTESEDPNLLPVVLLATYGEVDALLTADAETDVTARLLSRHVEILKVAHHGSADDGLESELRELRPEVAVISCGRGNDYGHPRPSTVAALRASPGLSLYRTDEDGRVVRRVGRQADHCPEGPLSRVEAVAAAPDLKPVYLLTGSDRPKIETALARLRRHFEPEAVELVTAQEVSGRGRGGAVQRRQPVR